MSRLSKNILYNLTGQILLAGLGFVAVKYVFKQLGGDALGIIYFTLALNVTLSSVLSMGIGETTVREVSAHFTSEPRYIRDLLRTASWFYWGLYALVAAGLYFGAPLLVHRWINLKTLDPGTAILVLRVLGIASFSALPRALYVSILRGLERMEFNNVIDVATSALQQCGTIVVLLYGNGLMSVVYWISACYGVAIIAYLLVCARFLSWGALLPGFSIGVARRNLSYASRMAMISLFAMIQMQADKAIVSKLLPLSLFGLYTVAYSAVSKGSAMTGAVFQGAFPHLSALDAAHDRVGLLSQYRKLQDLVCFGTVPLFAAIIFLASPLFSFMFKAQGARILVVPVAFLCVGFYMNGTLNIPYAFSLAVGKPGIAARLNFYALFCVLPVTVALVYFFGLPGAGFSWVFYHLFAYAYGLPRICRECLQSSAWAWYLHVLKVAALAAATYGVAWVVLVATGCNALLPLAVAYGAASGLFLLGSFFLIGPELRGSIRVLLRNLRTKYVEAI